MTTKNVVKATRSLDFMSNATKTTQTAFIGQMLTNTAPLETQPQVVHSSRTPMHPFIQYSDTVKLLNVMKMKMKTPVAYEAQLTDGRTVTMNEAHFITHKDVLRFFDSATTELYDLDVVQPFDYASTPVEDHLALQIKGLLTGINDQTLTKVMNVKFFDSHKMLFTNDLKLMHIIDTYTSLETVATIANFTQLYIKQVDNATIASKVFISLLPQLQSLTASNKRIPLLLTKQLYNSLSAQYPSASEDQRLQVSLLQTFIKCKDPASAYDILVESSSRDESPTSQIMTEYLQLLVNKVKHHSKTNLSSLDLLKGLNDVIYTTLDAETSRWLFRLCDHPDEISSVIDLIELKHPESLPSMLTMLEPVIMKRLFRPRTKRVSEYPSPSKTSKLAEFALKMSITFRIKQHTTGLTPESEKLILFEALKCDSFILAQRLLSSISLTQSEINELREMVMKHVDNGTSSVVDVSSRSDLTSRREFLKALDQYRLV